MSVRRARTRACRRARARPARARAARRRRWAPPRAGAAARRRHARRRSACRRARRRARARGAPCVSGRIVPVARGRDDRDRSSSGGRWRTMRQPSGMKSTPLEHQRPAVRRGRRGPAALHVGDQRVARAGGGIEADVRRRLIVVLALKDQRAVGKKTGAAASPRGDGASQVRRRARRERHAARRPRSAARTCATRSAASRSRGRRRTRST